MKRIGTICVYIFLLLSSACQHTGISGGAVTLDAEVIYRGGQCSGFEDGPDAVWILDAGHLAEVYGRLQGHILDPAVKGPPVVDFSRYAVLLAGMGQRPSAGYGLDLADNKVLLEEGTAVLKMLWLEPDPGSLRAQLVTSPCIMVKLPKDGYSSVSIQDQNDKALLKLNLPVK